MAAKGTIEKEQIIKTILSTFNGSFVTVEGKEMRIPIGDVEIKVALTCAKDVIGGVVSNTSTIAAEDIDNNFPLPKGAKIEVNVSEDEKANIQKLMEKFNL